MDRSCSSDSLLRYMLLICQLASVILLWVWPSFFPGYGRISPVGDCLCEYVVCYVQLLSATVFDTATINIGIISCRPCFKDTVFRKRPVHAMYLFLMSKC